MADGYLNFDTKINTSGFSGGLKSLSGLADKLKGAFSKIGSAITAAFSVAAVSAFAKECKSLYDVQLEAETKLTTILKEHLDATDKQVESVKEYASELQKVGVIGDEIQLSGLQELSTYIENPDSLKTMNRVLNDMLAQQYGLNATAESAVTISTMLGKVLEGQTSALSRYGYSFDEAQEKLLKFGTEEQRVATLAEVVESSVGGVNAALAQTPAGRMKQLSNTMGDIKEQFGAAVYQLEVLFLPLLNKLADMLAQIATLAEMAAAAIANVFGEPVKEIAAVTAGTTDTAEGYDELAEAAGNAADSVTGLAQAEEAADKLSDSAESSGRLADNADSAAESYGEMADAAEQAEKAANGSLASFDKLNKLSDNSQDTWLLPQSEKGADGDDMLPSPERIEELADAAPAVEKAADAVTGAKPTVEKMANMLSQTSPAADKLEGMLRTLKTVMAELFEPVKRAWDTYGEGVVNSAKTALGEIWELMKSIGGSFAEVWTNGTGEETLGHILGIVTNINTYAGNLAGSFRKAWNENGIGTDIIQHAADIFNIILGHVKNISAAWADWAGEVDFSPLLTAFDRVEQALKPIVDDLGGWLEDIYNDLIIPFSTWTTETLIPTVLDSIAKALEGLHAAWQTAYPVVKKKLWDEFLQPLAKWAGEKSVQLIKEFGDAVKEWGENLTEKDVEVFIDFAKAIGAITAAVKGAGLLSAFGTALAKLGTAIGPSIAAAGEGIGTAAGVSIGGAILPAIIAGIAGLGIGTMIRDAIGGDKIDEALFPIFDAIVKFFTETIPNWFGSLQTNVLFPIYDKFAEIGGEIAEMFSAAWGAVTAVWDFFEPYFTIIGDFITGVFRSAWEVVKGVWDIAAEYFSLVWENIKAVLETVGDVLGGFFVTAWENTKVVWELAGDFFGTVWDNIKLAFNAVEEFFRGNFEAAWEKVREIWNNTREFFGGVWSGIREIFGNVAEYLSNVFTSAWNAVSTIFSLKTVGKFFLSVVDKIRSVIGRVITIVRDTFKTAWEHIAAAFDLDNARTFFENVAYAMAEGFSYIIDLLKMPINGVLDLFNYLMDAVSAGFNAVTGCIESLVNSVADTVNSLSFDIPDWAGGGTLGFDLPHVTIPEISIPHLPKLAQGTVIPANYGEFAAILGDNKRETEVVSPLGTIKQALTEALRENGSGGDIYIYLDGEELSYSMERRSGKRAKRTGGA